MSSRFASSYRRPTKSMSCMLLIPAIRYVWPVTYAFNALLAPVPGEAMMSLVSGVLGIHELRATGHVAALEPSCTRRLV
jgi:hypothetical protein